MFSLYVFAILGYITSIAQASQDLDVCVTYTIIESIILLETCLPTNQVNTLDPSTGVVITNGPTCSTITITSTTTITQQPSGQTISGSKPTSPNSLSSLLSSPPSSLSPSLSSSLSSSLLIATNTSTSTSSCSAPTGISLSLPACNTLGICVTSTLFNGTCQDCTEEFCFENIGSPDNVLCVTADFDPEYSTSTSLPAYNTPDLCMASILSNGTCQDCTEFCFENIGSPDNVLCVTADFCPESSTYTSTSTSSSSAPTNTLLSSSLSSLSSSFSSLLSSLSSTHTLASTSSFSAPTSTLLSSSSLSSLTTGTLTSTSSSSTSTSSSLPLAPCYNPATNLSSNPCGGGRGLCYATTDTSSSGYGICILAIISLTRSICTTSQNCSTNICVEMYGEVGNACYDNSTFTLDLK